MAAPVLQNQSPAPGGVNALRSGPYYLELVDTVNGVDASSVIIWVNGQRVWESDAPTTGWTGTKTAIANGFSYNLFPIGVFPSFAKLTVRVYAEDTLANATDEQYLFTTGVRYYAQRDEFDDGVPPPQLAGNGAITEPSGELLYSVPGVNTDWYTFGRNGTMPYLSFAAPQLGKVTVETEMTLWDGSDGYNNHSMWGFYQNDQNFIWIYTDDAASAAPNFHAYKVIGNGWTYLGAYSGNPVTLPVKMRIVWDLETSQFEYQIYDGGWQTITTQTLTGFKPDREFWYLKSWGGRTLSMKHGYGHVYIDEYPVGRLESQQAAYEDAYKLPTAGGPVQHTDKLGRGVGQLIPGPPSQTLESVGPFDVGAYEDQYKIPTGGGPSRHTAVQTGLGQLVPGPPDQNPEVARGPLDVGAYEDVLTYLHSVTPEFNAGSFDIEGHPHFLNAEAIVFHATYYKASADPWATPTLNNFTGFAKNGKKYTNGVEDAGPVWAGWASEAPSNHRSSDAAFPDEVLIVTGKYEVVIFDLDSYAGGVASLKVWMRFYWDDSNYMSLGRGSLNIRDLKMANGTLVAVSQYDSSPATNGGVFAIDFKATGTNWLFLIRADGRWESVGAKNISNRNEISLFTQLSASLHVDSESIYRVDLQVAGTNGLYIVHVGDDLEDPQLTYLEDNQFQWRSRAYGDDLGSSNQVEGYKHVVFDDQGWLWTARDKRIYRHGRRYIDEKTILLDVADKLRPHVDLPYAITSIAAARDRIYAATAKGIYAIKRGTLEYWLAYTASGGGGRGRANVAGTGEILKGRHSETYRIYTISFSTSSYLGVPQDYRKKGAVTVIRLFDDFVVGEYEAPTLAEDGAYFAVVTPA